jgi:hypothetical protein
LTQLNEMMMGCLGGEPFAPASQSIASKLAPTFDLHWLQNLHPTQILVGASLLAMAILQAMNNDLAHSGNS